MEDKKFTQIVVLVDRDVADLFKRLLMVTKSDRKELLSEIVTKGMRECNVKLAAMVQKEATPPPIHRGGEFINQTENKQTRVDNSHP